jgi:hypothetical protein
MPKAALGYEAMPRAATVYKNALLDDSHSYLIARL